MKESRKQVSAWICFYIAVPPKACHHLHLRITSCKMWCFRYMAYTSEATRAHFTCPFFGKVMSNGKFCCKLLAQKDSRWHRFWSGEEERMWSCGPPWWRRWCVFPHMRVLGGGVVDESFPTCTFFCVCVCLKWKSAGTHQSSSHARISPQQFSKPVLKHNCFLCGPPNSP